MPRHFHHLAFALAVSIVLRRLSAQGDISTGDISARPKTVAVSASVTFLGITVAPPMLPAPISADSAGKLGLVVVTISPGSPVASVLKPGDSLEKLDEQILVNSEQLRVLVQTHRAGDIVNITFTRAGEKKNISVTLSSKIAGPLRDSHSLVILRPTSPGNKRITKAESATIAADVERLNAELGVIAPMVADSRSSKENGPTPPNASNGRFVYDFGEGSLEISSHDGKRSAIAKKKNGSVIFSGDVDTEEQRKAMPTEIRVRLEKFDREIVPKLRVSKFERLKGPIQGLPPILSEQEEI